MTATGPSGPPPGRSSAAVKVRPRAAGTPSTSNMRPLAKSPSTGSAAPPRARSKRVLAYAKAPSCSAGRSRTASQIGLVHHAPNRVSSPAIRTRRSACGTGRARSTSASAMENIAVFAPMPSASESTATAVTSGAARKARRTSRKALRRRTGGGAKDVGGRRRRLREDGCRRVAGRNALRSWELRQPRRGAPVRWCAILGRGCPGVNGPDRASSRCSKEKFWYSRDRGRGGCHNSSLPRSGLTF
jgi:hypothetical protein